MTLANAQARSGRLPGELMHHLPRPGASDQSSDNPWITQRRRGCGSGRVAVRRGAEQRSQVAPGHPERDILRLQGAGVLAVSEKRLIGRALLPRAKMLGGGSSRSSVDPLGASTHAGDRMTMCIINARYSACEQVGAQASRAWVTGRGLRWTAGGYSPAGARLCPGRRLGAWQ